MISALMIMQQLGLPRLATTSPSLIDKCLQLHQLNLHATSYLEQSRPLLVKFVGFHMVFTLRLSFTTYGMHFVPNHCPLLTFVRTVVPGLPISPC